MLRVLIIDDSPVFLNALKELLSHFPALEIVGTADNVNEGLFLTSELTPDVIFVDVNMPGQTGFKVTECLLALCPATRVIIISFNDLPAYREQALAVGAKAFISKSELTVALPDVLADFAASRFSEAVEKFSTHALAYN